MGNIKQNTEKVIEQDRQVDDIVRRDSEFKDALRNLLNRYSMENNSNTPDFILAEYMFICLCAYEKAIEQREAWHSA